MEIVSIETKAFEKMKDTLGMLCRKMHRLCIQCQPKRLDEWLDNQDVCVFLNISPRTLQTLRSNGSITFTQIERKLYYRKKDVVQLLENKNLKIRSQKLWTK